MHEPDMAHKGVAETSEAESEDSALFHGRAGGHVARTPMLGVRAGPALLERADMLARQVGLTRSEVVRLALAKLCDEGLPNGLDADLMRAARMTD